MLSFETTIKAHGPAAAIILTPAQANELSTAKQPPVVVTIGQATARLRVTRMGGPACIGLSKANRKRLGVEIGDQVHVQIELDAAERVVDVPADLVAALAAEPELQAAWDALSYTRRKEIARGLVEAKQDATRQRRLARAVAELRG